MIYFTADTHLVKIEKFSKITDMKTKRYYRVYGLKNEDQPPVLIEYLTMPANKTEKEIRGFLRRNGFPVEFTHPKYRKSDDIEIGLRLDVREHLYLSAAIVNSLIGYFENKVNLPTSPSSFGIPKLVQVDEEEEKEEVKKDEKVLDFQTAKY